MGYVNPFGIWAPGTVVRTQCDATAFLSAGHYAEWYLPYDERICEAVDYSIIHLHSCSLHTVDVLLEVERPHAIQVTLGVGAQRPVPGGGAADLSQDPGGETPHPGRAVDRGGGQLGCRRNCLWMACV